MELNGLCRHLSSSVATHETAAAARSLLDLPDPNDTLSRVYAFLVWQRTLRTALSHLAEAGADLSSLAVSEAAFRSTFPARFRAIWDVDVTGPQTGTDLLEIYSTHRRLVGTPISKLARAGIGGFTLVSGRAYEARYPHYSDRVEFDTDLVVSDMEAAWRVTSFLRHEGFWLDSLRIRRLGPSPDATFELRRHEEGHLVSVGLLVGGYHAHRRDIYQNSTEVDYRGGRTLAARPEDLLVMLAVRVERKRKFSLVNYNDAATILQTDGPSLDWESVAMNARAAGVGATLAVILRHAEALIAGSAVPQEAWPALVRSPADRLLSRLACAHATRDTSVTEHGRRRHTRSVNTVPDRVWRLWVRLGRGDRRAGSSIGSLAIQRVQQQILDRQLSALGSNRIPAGVHRALAGFRTRCGALCEVAPHLAADTSCLSVAGGRVRRAAAPVLLEEAQHLSDQAGPHACSRMTFNLATADGT